MWLVFAGVTLLLVALIVAIAMGSEISTATSALILLACGVISAALVVVSSRSPADRAGSEAGQSTRTTGDWGAGQVSNWVFLADTYAEREEFEYAEKLYRRAAEAGHTRAMSSLGEVLYEMGRDDEAEYFRQRAREAGA